MSKLPTVVKVLKYLRDEPTPSTYIDINRAIRDGQVQVRRALTELVARGLIDRCDNDRYLYRATPDANALFQKLSALYDKVSTRQQKELLIRGLLSQPGPRYLWHRNKLLEVLEGEGFTKEETVLFLDQETEKGYINNIKVIFVISFPFTAPPFIPYYNMSDLRNIKPEEYKQLAQQCRKSGLSTSEENYLIGKYPLEVSRTAVQYIEEEKHQMRDVLWEGAFQQWQGLTYSW
jgi:hypothetical protein